MRVEPWFENQHIPSTHFLEIDWIWFWKASHTYHTPRSWFLMKKSKKWDRILDLKTITPPAHTYHTTSPHFLEIDWISFQKPSHTYHEPKSRFQMKKRKKWGWTLDLKTITHPAHAFQKLIESHFENHHTRISHLEVDF